MSPRPDGAGLDALARLGTATIGEVAGPRARIMDGGLRALAPLADGAAGVALTVRCRPGDNLAIHLALARAQPGDMLVIDYGGDTGTAPFGEIMACAARTAGVRGLVINGAVRDGAAIVSMGFSVFSRGMAIAGTTKEHRGEIGAGCAVAGVDVAQGDIVVGDDDGVLVFDAVAVSDILERGRDRLTKEAGVMDRIRDGETTCDIFGLN